MKKISLLFTLFIAFLAFTSCSSKSELVIEVPELSQGEITIIYATPDQIDSRQQETLKTVQITNGKAQIVFDTISFDKKIKDCTMLIQDTSKQFAYGIPLPLEKGKTLTIKISGIDKYLQKEDYLKITYSGSKKAEEFICHDEIMDTLAYADAHKDDLTLVREILFSTLKDLSLLLITDNAVITFTILFSSSYVIKG